MRTLQVAAVPPSLAGVLLLSAIAGMGSLAACRSRDPRLHPSVPNLDTIATRQTRDGQIGARQAVGAAIGMLRSKGVTDILVCRVTTIEAPLGGFVIDATGRLVQGTNRYSLFRIGIRDGSDGPQYPGGSQFVFVAKGVDGAGRPAWIPPPGPDAAADETGFVAEYEFLYDRAEFEQVPARCRR